MNRPLLLLLLASITSVALAQLVGQIPDHVFVDAAKELRQVIRSRGSDEAKLHVTECYRVAMERERMFGSMHAACITKDYLLIAVLALPYDRAEWYPPKRPEDRYEQLAPALQERIAQNHARLGTAAEIVDDTRRKMFSVGAIEFKLSEEQ